MAKKTNTVVIDGDKLMKALSGNENLRLTHAVLVGETCTYSYSVRLENGDTDIMTNECGRQYHNDLKQAFRKFDGHLAVITEQVDADDVADIDECEGKKQKVTENLLRHQVTEVKLFGNIETGSVVLSGAKILKSSDEIKLKTPKAPLDGEYDFVNELVAATQNLIDEITAYHNGKSRPEAQMDMFKEAEKGNENDNTHN